MKKTEKQKKKEAKKQAKQEAQQEKDKGKEWQKQFCKNVKDKDSAMKAEVWRKFCDEWTSFFFGNPTK